MGGKILHSGGTSDRMERMTRAQEDEVEVAGVN